MQLICFANEPSDDKTSETPKHLFSATTIERGYQAQKNRAKSAVFKSVKKGFKIIFAGLAATYSPTP